MSEQTHIAPDGVKYRLVATHATTPTSDTTPKPITVNTQMIEVLILDSRMSSISSIMGDVAMVVDDVVYPREAERYFDDMSRAQYVKAQ